MATKKLFCKGNSVYSKRQQVYFASAGIIHYKYVQLNSSKCTALEESHTSDII